jgi:putative DNA primase/helicase
MEGFDIGEELINFEEKREMQVETPETQKTDNVPPALHAVSLADFLTLNFPKRENILSPWLPTQGLVMIYGPRGYGKTFTMLGISVAITSGGKFMRWEAPTSRGVIYIDGEMPAVVLQERLSRIIQSSEKEPIAPFKIITPDLQKRGMPDITTLRGQLSIEQHLDNVDLVIVDNLSCLCRTGKENEAEGWLPVQEWALSLRARGKSVLFVHHAGKDGAQRGTSKREDVLDTVISLKRPGDYKPEEGARFEVHFEKARGIYGDIVKPFEVHLMNESDGKLSWNLKDLEESLTERVAQLLNEGIAQKDIADMLKISKGTVSKHKHKAAEQGLLKK